MATPQKTEGQKAVLALPYYIKVPSESERAAVRNYYIEKVRAAGYNMNDELQKQSQLRMYDGFFDPMAADLNLTIEELMRLIDEYHDALKVKIEARVKGSLEVTFGSVIHPDGNPNDDLHNRALKYFKRFQRGKYTGYIKLRSISQFKRKLEASGKPKSDKPLGSILSHLRL